MKTSHLNALRALEATLRTGNFSSAADELGVTAAAVGQQVRGLEDYVGRQLFRRTPTGAMPTEFASRLADRLTTSFGTLGDVLSELRRSGPSNRLAPSMTQAFGESWLTPRLPEFYAMADEVDLRIDTTHRLVDLLGDEFDFAMRFGPPPAGPLEGELLFGGCTVPICTPDFAARYDLSPSVKSLRDVPLVHIEDETSDPTWPKWADWSERFGFEYESDESVPQFSRLSSGLRVAKAGLGLVLCGMLESFPSLQAGSLVMPFGPGSVVWTDYQYHLAWARGRTHYPVQQSFKEWIIAQAEAYRKSVDDLLASGSVAPA